MRRVRASVTVEAAFLVPIILMVISVTITLLFYYHDKVVIRATLYETVTVMSSREDPAHEEMEQYYREQMRGKLFLFPSFQVETQIDSEELSMSCFAKQKRMKIQAEASMKRTDPEMWVRIIKKRIGE